MSPLCVTGSTNAFCTTEGLTKHLSTTDGTAVVGQTFGDHGKLAVQYDVIKMFDFDMH